MSPNIYIYTMHIRIFRMSICTVAFAYQCPIVLAFQYYPRRNACVCEHWKFCFDCKDWSLHSTSIWLLSPLQDPWKCEALIAAPCEPDRPTRDSDNALRKDVFCICFHGAFWIFQIDFCETIVLSSLVHNRSTSLGLLAVWHSEPGQACESFQSWGHIGMTYQDIGVLGLGLWRATLTWNLRKQINRNL